MNAIRTATVAVGWAMVAQLGQSQQCADWSSGFGALGVAGTSNTYQSVQAQVGFDDGSGWALFVGGYFKSAGDVASGAIAKWNGHSWSALGAAATHASSDAGINALGVYDDGNGPALYAGGIFQTIGGVNATCIAKWDGANWTPLAQGLEYPVLSLATFDDGNGTKLYAACHGPSQGGFVSRIAAWDGTSWIDAAPSPDGEVRALEVHDDGSGAALYCGGRGIVVNGAGYAFAKFSGGSWTGIPGLAFHANGAQAPVYALKSFDDGAGPALYAGGWFAYIGAQPASNVAKWDGAGWSPLASGTNEPVRSFEEFDDNSGAALYVGGEFDGAGGIAASHIARWRGGAWSALDNLGSLSGTPFAPIQATSLLAHDDGSGGGPALYAGGYFASAGGARADNVARWNASGWFTLGVTQGFDDRVTTLGAYHASSGVEVYAAGWFDHAGTTPAPGFAKRNGTGWSPIALDGSGIYAFENFDDGGGEKLYAGGTFAGIEGVDASNIASWDGTQWAALGTGTPSGQTGSIYALEVFDDGAGPALWAGGAFTTIGGVSAKRVARWDGTNWSSPPTGPSGNVQALAIHDDGMGGGIQLYVGGYFVKVGSVNYFGIARWNGATWSQVGNGFDTAVRALAVFDDHGGNGPQLYAAGDFSMAPPAATAHIARWDGVAWQPLGAGVDGVVYTLETFDDGADAALYAGGLFGHAGGAPASYLAKWNGSLWSSAAGGTNGPVNALLSIAEGSSSASVLYVGGPFTAAGSSGSSRIAKLARRCPCPPLAYCTAGISSNGCAATLNASGTLSASAASSFVVTASNVEGQKPGVLFYGINGSFTLAWGTTSSFLCVKSPQQRTPQQNSGGSAGACDGAFALDWNAYLAANPGALGNPFLAGDLVWFQGWYRDPPSSKTTALTNGLQVLVCP